MKLDGIPWEKFRLLSIRHELNDLEEQDLQMFKKILLEDPTLERINDECRKGLSRIGVTNYKEFQALPIDQKKSVLSDAMLPLVYSTTRKPIAPSRPIPNPFITPEMLKRKR